MIGNRNIEAKFFLCGSTLNSPCELDRDTTEGVFCMMNPLILIHEVNIANADLVFLSLCGWGTLF